MQYYNNKDNMKTGVLDNQYTSISEWFRARRSTHTSEW